MHVTQIPQLVRNADRFREVVRILAKHGLADWLAKATPVWFSRFGFPQAENTTHTFEHRVRLAICDLGTTFVKLGQVLSTRPDLVGARLADELAGLRADAPADQPEIVVAMIESELGQSVHQLFAKFDSVALASASIGQVHCATTHAGEEVVVKVQHPGIENRIVNDLEIMEKLAELAEQYSSYLRQFRPVKTTQEFSKTLIRELDFGRELRNMVEFRENFADHPYIKFPAPHGDLSSRRVLTMERFDGISISHREELEGTGLNLDEIAREGANLFVDMIFRDGFYHADPHPGNLMVLKQAGGSELLRSDSTAEAKGLIGILDCGMVGRIDDSLREDMELALIAAVRHDANRITEVVARVGDVPADFDERALLESVQEFMNEYTHQSIDDFDLSGCLNGIISIIREHRIYLPAKVAMLFKVLVMLEGTAQQLSPKFSLAELIGPYGERAIRARFSPKRLFGRGVATYQDWDRLLTILPKDLADILHNVKRGKFDVHLEHRRLEHIVNRLVMGILTAALFMGSASLCSYQVPPAVYGFSIPGVLGCLVAVKMGWSINRAITRANRNK